MKPPTLDDLDADLSDAIATGDADRIHTAGAAIDKWEAEHPPKQPPTMLSAALWYASVGLRVFPLQPRAKIPHKGTRGVLDACSDPDTIRQWWDRWPGSNVGIATGHLVDVVDIDGPQGQASLARELLDDHGIWQGPPVLGKVSTPRPGGLHIYVAAIEGTGNKAALLPGIDTRGLGGYVVAPPSVNTDWRRYEWTVPLTLP